MRRSYFLDNCDLSSAIKDTNQMIKSSTEDYLRNLYMSHLKLLLAERVRRMSERVSA